MTPADRGDENMKCLATPKLGRVGSEEDRRIDGVHAVGQVLLDHGLLLAESVDYRDVMGEVLVHHLGNGDPTTLLPGHFYQPVGFLSA